MQYSTIEKLRPDEISEKDYILVDTPDLWKLATHFTLVEDEEDPYKSHVLYFIKRTSIYTRMGGGEGYVYVLGCKNQPGILKIGMTERTPVERLKDINRSAGVIFPWYILEAFPCKAPRAIEAQTHLELDKYRVNSHKEGFNLPLEDAVAVIKRIIDSYDAHTEPIQKGLPRRFWFTK